jgi:hypothetical protein
LGKKIAKNNKSKEAEPGNKSCTSKRKASSQQSAPLASVISTMETAKKPKEITEEAAVLPPCAPEVAKGTSSVSSETNVMERKIAALLKYVAVLREDLGQHLWCR